MISAGIFLRKLSSIAQVAKTKTPIEINKILIANRGEIACRVIRTARKLGVRTVAVYSEADEKSLHIQLADEAYYIGKAPSDQSYLCSDKVIAVAKKSNCQAIHPGYGFLSESTEFAELCRKEGVIFMGPPASAIRDMGIKNTSKAIMSAAGVPIIKGYHGDDQSDAKLFEEAKKIGFPVMIKAIRGGGGKGMRIAETAKDFLDALNSARTESQKSFGDSSVLLERFVTCPRHVEVQVFADSHGNAVYLFERDCSVQRRHQKIIEEAPAPGLSEELRKELGEAAVRAAKAVSYVGAGTVEFILDKDDLSFYFMEMNTRLQVEHPITEMITGVDLVEWQIRIAAGDNLPLTQNEIQRNGHAFEARVYAENPKEGFLPGAGVLDYLSTPTPTENVRVETGVRQGDEVSVHYDPMIAKLVVWGKNRIQALDNLIARLGEYQITGVETNINFLIDLARHKHFRSGDVHTDFIPQHYDSLFKKEEISENMLSKAIIGLYLHNSRVCDLNKISGLSISDPYTLNSGMRMNHNYIEKIKLYNCDKEYVADVKNLGNNIFEIKVENGNWKKVTAYSQIVNGRFKIKCNIDGVISNYTSVIAPEEIALFDENGKFEFGLMQPKFLFVSGDGQLGSESSIVSPMPGILEKILVKPGDTVNKGDPVAILIAMKMEYVLRAPKEATVKLVNGNIGNNIKKGAIVIEFE